jgi:hypothetical protein
MSRSAIDRNVAIGADDAVAAVARGRFDDAWPLKGKALSDG